MRTIVSKSCEGIAVLEPLEPRWFLAATPANIQITSEPAPQQQPSITVDQHNTQRLALAYMDYSLVSSGYAGIGVAVSSDGGKSWHKSSIPLPANFDQGAAQPIAQFDGEGRLFVSFMAATFLGPQPRLTDPNGLDADGNQFRSYGMTANNGIFVTRSDDGGSSWSAPVAIVSHLYDGNTKVPFEIKPDLAIDTFRTLPDGRANPNYGTMYAVWSRYFPAGQYPGQPTALGGSNIMLAVSRDQGQSWQVQLEPHPEESAAPITVIFNKGARGLETPEGLGFENWSHVTVGPEGDVYVSQFLGGQFVVHHSINGGASFAHPDSKTGGGFPFGVNTPMGPGPLSANRFRLQSVRAIAPDPTRPGTVYIAEANQTNAPQGGVADEGEVLFARSTDYGVTWETHFQLGAGRATAVNDDNDGTTATGLASEVAAAQALPRLVTDAQGNVALIWYDMRRDPAGHLLDVFGTISRDGGKTFSSNFRITDQAIDADAGKFTDALGRDNFNIGDFLGLALSNGSAYAAWTDTRGGNQDIFFSTFPIAPVPAAANDRFEPNDDASSATALGSVVQRVLAKLHIAAGDSDVFTLQTEATGTLKVTGAQARSGKRLRLELLDESGVLLATSAPIRTKTGRITGERISYPSKSGDRFMVRVSSTNDASTRYDLDIQGLTANLGTITHHVAGDTLGAGDQDYFLFAASASGSIRTQLVAGADARRKLLLEILDPKTLEVLATSTSNNIAAASVVKGQSLLARVRARDGSTALGSYALRMTNLDQFAPADNRKFFFPSGAGPSEAALADLNADGNLDVVVSHVGRDFVSVLMNDGNGTFQAPRDFAVGAFQQGGPFTLQGLQNFHRDLAIADFNRDGIADVAVVNTSSSDVSILLGHGDGTFAPQRRYDATAAPFAMDVGDLNSDGIPDVAVIDSTADAAKAGVLLGRGDGSFQVLRPFEVKRGEPFRTNSVRIADLNSDGKNDLVVRDFVDGTYVLTGNGDGTFQPSTKGIVKASGPGLEVADLNNDGKLDVVTTENNTGNILYVLGNGDGKFQNEAPPVFAGQFPVAVQVVDFGSSVEGALGPPDGHVDLIVAANGRTLPTLSGPAEVALLPGLVDAQQQFSGFGDPIRLAAASGPLDVKTSDVNHDGAIDVVVVDREGILVIFGKQPDIPANSTRDTARNLGTVVHVVQPTLTIVPGREDSWYALTVPTEAAPGSGDEIIDFSGLFEQERGAGLEMEILDADGKVLASGEHLTLRARQGQGLYVHIFGREDSSGQRGSGAYTLDIAVLPQLISVEAQSLLPGTQVNVPGGPTTSLVLTFQGDRLEQSPAENPANYTVTFLGADGVAGTDDDRTIAISATDAAPAVYNPSANIDVISGRTYPTAVKQTVTLLFAEPLPAGSYRVDVSTNVQASAFNESETALIGDRHSVSTLSASGTQRGASFLASGVVAEPTVLGDLSIFKQGTPFLSQLHSDLGALLDQQLTTSGDAAAKQITRAILSQIIARLGSGAMNLEKPILALFLDPVGIDLEDPGGSRLSYNLDSGALDNQIGSAFVSVASNVELIVMPADVGTFTLNVSDVPATARGGAIILDQAGVQMAQSITSEMRRSNSQFQFTVQSNRGGDPPRPVVTSTRQTGDLVPDVVETASARSDPFTLSLLTSPGGSVTPSGREAGGGASVTSSVVVVATHTVNSFAYQPKSELDAAARQRFLTTLSAKLSSWAQAIRAIFPVIFGPRRAKAITPVDPSQASPAPERGSPPRNPEPATQPAGAQLRPQAAPRQQAKRRDDIVPAIEQRSDALGPRQAGAAQALAGLAVMGGMVRLAPTRKRARRRASAWI